MSPVAPLFRDPADWARDWGWVSPLRAGRAAARLRGLAEGIRDTRGELDVWAAELEAIAKYLDPATVRTRTKRRNRRRVGKSV